MTWLPLSIGMLSDGVDIGAATAAGLAARLVQHDARACLRKPRGGGKPSKAGANDVDRARRHAT